MSLNVTSGIVYTSGPTITVNATPVNIFGAAAASSSGTAGITHYSGALNVNISGGSISASVSGNIVLVVSGGAIQVSGVVSVSGNAVVVSMSGGEPMMPVYAISGTKGSGLVGVGLMSWDTAASQWLPAYSAQSGRGTLRTSLINDARGGGGVIAQVDAFNSDGYSAGTAGLFTGTGQFVLNGNWDRLRGAAGLSGGTQSGTGIGATQILGFDLSGKAYRNISTVASGSTALQVATAYQYSLVSGANIVNVQSGASILHTITVNAWTSGGQLAILDSLSGNTGNSVGVIDFIEVGSIATQAFAPQTLTYDCYMTSGIVIVTSGATLNATVTFKSPP